jgi:hypothetical protein
MKLYETNLMKRTLLIFVMLGSVIVAKGQGPGYLNNKESVNSLTIEPFTQKQVKLSNVNYFLNEEWQGGLIQLENDRNVNGYLYRYNIFTDQIELKSIIEPSSVKIISIGVQKFIYSDYVLSEDLIYSGYFEVIANGECKLLKRRYIRSNEQDYRVNKILGTSDAAPTSSVIKEYYIKKGSGPAVLMNKTKGSFLDILSDKKPFHDYLKKKFIIIVNENKMIELINYYNKI